MNDLPAEAAIRLRVRAALERPMGGPLGSAIAVPAVTVLVVRTDRAAEALAVLAELVPAIERAGVARGRQFALISPGSDLAIDRTLARAIRERLALPALIHDPDRSPCFRAGVTSSGIAIDVNDELREAEALVVVAEVSAGDAARAGTAIVPGLASRSTRRALQAESARVGKSPGGHALDQALREALELVPVDFALVWENEHGRAGRVIAGTGDRMLSGG